MKDMEMDIEKITKSREVENTNVRYERYGRSGADFYYNEKFVQQDSVRVRFFRPSAQTLGLQNE